MRIFTTVLALAVLAWAGPASALTATFIVKGPKSTCATASSANVQANGGWSFSPSAGANYDLVAGPLVPPSGVGSLLESVSAAGPVMSAVYLGPLFAGQSLSGFFASLGGISYDNLDISTFTGALPAFAVFVDLDANGSTDDTIVYYPAVTGCAGFGAWTTCPVLAGLFFGSNPAADPDGNLATPFTALDYATFNAAAQLPASPNPLFGLILGTGPVFSAAACLADNLVFDGSAPLVGSFDDIRFDFEPDCSAYGTDADADCYCETLDASVLNWDQCDGTPPSTTSDDNFDANGDGDNDTDGDGLHECLDNCPLVANPGQEDSDGDGEGDACESTPPVPSEGQVTICHHSFEKGVEDTVTIGINVRSLERHQHHGDTLGACPE